MESDLPWFHAAVRELLAADEPFMTSCAERLLGKAPSEVTKGTLVRPYAIIQFPTAIGSMGGGGYRGMVQVDGCCPLDGYDGDEASKVAWRIVSRAKRAFETARNVQFETMRYSTRPTDLMPLPADVSRGEGSPLVRAMCRAILTAHNT